MTTVYIQAFPWISWQDYKKKSNELYETRGTGLPRSNRGWSWLAIYYDPVTFDLPKERSKVPFDPLLREKYKSVIERYKDDERIAFSAIVLPEKWDLTDEERQELIDLVQAIRPREENLSQEIQENAILFRLEDYREQASRFYRKKFPDNYRKILAVALVLQYSHETWDGKNQAYGVRPKIPSGNASAEPKTVGQIAQQLLESWDAPPANVLLNNP